jgi:hypothetical protein
LIIVGKEDKKEGEEKEEVKGEWKRRIEEKKALCDRETRHIPK